MVDFRVGDIVQLKSGGPKMTISEASPGLREGHWNRVWFEGSKRHAAIFKAETLKKVDGD